MTTERAQEKIAVIIAAWNASETIGRAVRSALSEPETAEVIVVDDASADDTAAAARACDDGSGRLKIVTQAENAGPSAARNRALRESTAPWIAVLDSDDFFLPGRLKGLLSYAEQADLIADDLWQVPEENPDGPRRALIGDFMTLPRPVGLTDFVLSNVTGAGRGERRELGFIKPLMRRAVLTRAAISYDEKMRLGEDYDLYVRALAAGARLLLVPAQGYVSVVREGSLSGRHSEADLLALRDCDPAIAAAFSLGGAEKKALRRHYLDTDCRLQWRLLIRAVKDRNACAALKTFLRPWPVPLYLARCLTEQAVLRACRRLIKQ